MPELVMIVPSRGRPQAAHELVKAFDETCSNHDTRLLFAIDKRDVAGIYDYPFDQRAVTVWFESTNMGEALNLAAQYVLAGQPNGAFGPQEQPPFAIGFMGDDHRPRTVGWDRAYLTALEDMGSGIVYGNDLLQGENIPTQVAMTSDIIRALGYMAPPSLVHLYFDNFWKVLGNGADCLRYLPDVIVEHMHPVAGKAKWDEGYVRVNSQNMYEHDKAAFDDWLRTSMLSDVAKVRALR